ncbi:HisA/HisF-related TIM barrel protein, partial [Verrucomicrobiota bacterium]
PVPVVASGGAGSTQHLVDVFTEGCADAAIIASIIHSGKYTIRQIKEVLAKAGVPVRRKW